MSDVALRQRDRRRRWALPHSRHDRVVAVLRVALPSGVGVLTAFLVMAPLGNGNDVSFVLDKTKVQVAPERLRITQPDYRGQDAKGQPFTLTAQSAVQRTSAEHVVQLTRLDAQVRLTGGPATVHADQGRYETDAQRVAIVGPVHVQSATGYTLDTQNATLDLKTRQLASDTPVTGTVPQGHFSADRLRADLDSEVVVLDGHARLRLTPGHAK